MKGSQFIKAASVGLLSIGLAVLPYSISASAQDLPGTEEPIPAVETEDEFDWGWLGLLGLIGLAGLAGRKRVDEPTRYRDPRDPTVAPNTEYRR